MRRFALLLPLLLSLACAEPDPPDTYRYTCTTYAGCDGEFDSERVPVCGTLEEIRQFSGEWTHACSEITVRSVGGRGDCTRIVCGVICNSTEGFNGPAECPANEELRK